MSKEHIQNLKTLRDQLVNERRQLIASILADPHSAAEASGELMHLQQFIDVVERAISHEESLDRPAGSWGPRQQMPPNMPPRNN